MLVASSKKNNLLFSNTLTLLSKYYLFCNLHYNALQYRCVTPFYYHQSTQQINFQITPLLYSVIYQQSSANLLCQFLSVTSYNDQLIASFTFCSGL